MLLIVGLGNPGVKYRDTRHNIGFMALDYMSDANGIKSDKDEFHSFLGKGSIQGKRVILAKPHTFMNLSGESVQLISDYFSIEPKNVLIIYDDIDLELGLIRIRIRGGSGGHKGMESIISSLGTNNFPRIRLGIGRPKDRGQGEGKVGQIADYVLSTFSNDEKKTIKESLCSVQKAVDVILKDGIEKAMNIFNKKL